MTILILLVFAGQALAGPSAKAVLSLDLIADGGAGNQRNGGVTSGTVSGQDTNKATPSPGFDGDGMVGIPDYLLFKDRFGSMRGGYMKRSMIWMATV